MAAIGFDVCHKLDGLMVSRPRRRRGLNQAVHLGWLAAGGRAGALP